MKSYEIKSWLYWGAFLMLLLFMFSCKSQKPTIEQSEVNNNFKFQADTTLINVTKTQPFENNFALKFPKIRTNKPECDSICQVKLNEALSMISINQKNGKNETNFYYDKYKHTLYLYNKMAGTVDSISNHVSIKKEYYEIKKLRTITITTNILTNEQKFNLWVGRIFWLLLVAVIIYKIKK